ncbi:MAG: hypothetical protein DRH17_09585 [Deltaproteobacteria bacterium]|nr:MAG: hypothetical protein DRH17_09585 [Deltaproteobacteria bacterium]
MKTQRTYPGRVGAFWATLGLILSLILFLPGNSSAKVTGVCSNCHTMHYSQNGTQLSSWGSDGPYQNLTTSNCVGCHSAADGATWQDAVTGAPIVYNASAPSYNTQKGLAAGNFYYVAQDQTKGHNVTDIPGVSQDSNFTSTPGGTGSTCSACHGGGNMVLTKCVFCHDAKDAHHADDSATVVGESGGYYRFLSFTYYHPSSFQEGLGFYGCEGIEDSDWEKTVTSTDHNEYAGAPASGNSHSISKYCACCHEGFHGTANTQSGSSWIRHPSDHVLPNSGEYASYTTYSPEAPIARDPTVLAGMTGPSQTVTPGSDQVSCLSCHRAHGSPKPDMLRWDYSGMIAGSGENTGGCFVCHTTKDTGGS